jgi:hypothetical protein
LNAMHFRKSVNINELLKGIETIRYTKTDVQNVKANITYPYTKSRDMKCISSFIKGFKEY